MLEHFYFWIWRPKHFSNENVKVCKKQVPLQTFPYRSYQFPKYEESYVCNGIRIIEKHELSLLGSPLFPEALRSVLEPKLENLKLMTSTLREIDNHEALFLLRHCFTIPKLTYFLRTSPCFMAINILENFDETIKDSLVDILNISLSESAYRQLTLPIVKGGLGLRLTTEIALSGYLSSVCATKSTARLNICCNQWTPNAH